MPKYLCVGAYREDKLYRGTQLSHHLIVEESKKFIRANKDSPFFCYLPWTPPHGPYPDGIDDPAIDDFADRPWSRDDKIYAGMVNALDRGVSNLVATLKANGQFDNTLIVFLSDNGGRTDAGAKNTPLKGVKGDTWEGGFRVPCVVRWPGLIKPGTKIGEIMSHEDWLPTLLNAAGVPEEHIESSRICTRCRTDEFFSYRAEKITGRFAAVIGMKDNK